MECLTCEQLTAEFERLERNCVASRAYLDEAKGISNVSEYRRAKIETNEAWLEREVSRIELERHQRTHSMPLG